MVYDTLNCLYQRMMRNNKRVFRLSYQEEFNILTSMDLPMSDISRSYSQYVCHQRACLGFGQAIILEIGAFLLFIPTLLFFLFYNFFLPPKEHKAGVSDPFLIQHHLIPSELLNEYRMFGLLDRKKARLNIDDLKFICSLIMNHPISFHFNYKCIWMIAVYSFAFYEFNPNVVVCSMEDSFTSSILTLYCEQKNILHCNVMHGEKGYYIRDAFSRFSRFYVWDEHYINVLKNLKCEADFRVYAVKTLELKENRVPRYVEYILQIHTSDELCKIKTALDRIGKKYKVRPHPAHNTMTVYKVFNADTIDNPSTISIEESLEHAEMIIAQDSTVLYQAYLLHIPVIIDDITNPKRYSEMKYRQYIMFSKPHMLLSDFIRTGVRCKK